VYSQIIGSITVYTRNGKPVAGLIINEMTAAEISGSNSYWISRYPNARLIGNSSATYNCHSYAWNMIDGGPTCWINRSEPVTADPSNYSNIANYWTNDYFYSTASQAVSQRVHYYDSDHSAILETYIVVPKYRSKWGSGPLMEHAISDCPYPGGRAYYTSPSSTSYDYGNLSCSDWDGFIKKETNVTFGIPSNAPTGSGIQAVWSVLDQHGDDAVENGRATIISMSSTSITVQYHTVGIHEILCTFYSEGVHRGYSSYSPIIQN
jgi:hypothetical protein